MSERPPRLDKREIRLPDGRRLIYYAFPLVSPSDEASTSSSTTPPRREEP
jgi:hypothetical protein